MVDQEKSRIQVDAKATGHAFTGTLEKYKVAAKGDSATAKPTGFDLEWSFKDLKTADKDRDTAMIDWLGGGNPKGSFKFFKSWNDDKGRTYAMGKLTIKGVSKTVSFSYTTKREGKSMTIDGRVGMDYEDFGLPVIRKMALLTVDPKLTVRFHIVGNVK